MKHFSIKNAFIFSLVYISFEVGLIMANMQYSEHASFYSYASSSLSLMIAIALTAYASAKENSGLSFINDIKNGLKTTGVYALLVASFLVLYHSTIVPDYADIRIENIRESAENTPFEVITAQNSDMTKEDFISQQVETAKFWLSPKKVFPMALLGIMALGMVYSFAFTAIFRKFLFRN